MTSEYLNTLIKQVPLKTKINTILLYHLMDLMVETGLRDDKEWNDEDPNDVYLIGVLTNYTRGITTDVMKEVEEKPGK